MKPLEPSDAFHVRAAEGWLELGNHVEAAEELAKVAPEQSSHPAVLTLQWNIYEAKNKWESALEIATALIRLNPEEVVGWLHRSYALHKLQRTPEARDNLLGVIDRFQFSAPIHYSLACYECQLGRLKEARPWLERAFDLDDGEETKLAAPCNAPEHSLPGLV